jgi:hypothetical protein
MGTRIYGLTVYFIPPHMLVEKRAKRIGITIHGWDQDRDLIRKTLKRYNTMNPDQIILNLRFEKDQDDASIIFYVIQALP